MAKGATVYTDHWEAYEEILPYEGHVRGKTGTCTVEGLNGVFRHLLARLRRRTKCYSKSELMLKYSLNLLILKRNNLLSILN